MEDRYSEIINASPARGFARGLFYSLAVVVAMIFAFSELDRGSFNSFRISILLVFVIFGVELWTSWRLRQLVHSQTKLRLGDVSTRMAELLNHVLIPLNVFVWSLSFGYFNSQQTLRLVVLVVMFLVLMFLFTNIRSYYLNRQELWLQTNFTYDIAKFYIFFTFGNSVINLAGQHSILVPILMSLGAFGLLALTILRYQKVELFGIVNSAIVSLVLLLLLLIVTNFTMLNTLGINLIGVVFYYLGAAFVHHRMERDLTKELVLEYLSIAGMAIVVAVALG